MLPQADQLHSGWRGREPCCSPWWQHPAQERSKQLCEKHREQLGMSPRCRSQRCKYWQSWCRSVPCPFFCQPPPLAAWGKARWLEQLLSSKDREHSTRRHCAWWQPCPVQTNCDSAGSLWKPHSSGDCSPPSFKANH